MLKSNQDSKYETACFIQEAPTEADDWDPRGFKIKKAITGEPFIVFPATMQTFGVRNRMQRIYDANNVISVINNDERIQRLKRQNKWRGELNHPNPDIKGQVLSDIRMTIPDPDRTSHMINDDHLDGNRLRATITTHPKTKAGQQVTSEVIDLKSVPSFSVRVLGNMIPNAPAGQPNIRVARFITVDCVDFPSHPGADGDIREAMMEQALQNWDSNNVKFLQELAKYACEQDETLQVVCESFQISPEEIKGICNESICIQEQSGAHIRIPLRGEIRREIVNYMRGMR